MNTIRIAYDEETEQYSYECPFCKQRRVYPDDYECEHLVFAYEEVNNQTLSLGDGVENILYDILMEKRVSFLQNFCDRWEDYRPYTRRSTNPEEWDSAKGEAVQDFLYNGMNVADFLKIIRCSEFRNRIPDFVFAETEEDVAGFGKTTIILSDKILSDTNQEN